jgi:hypothetical protein
MIPLRSLHMIVNREKPFFGRTPVEVQYCRQCYLPAGFGSPAVFAYCSMA